MARTKTHDELEPPTFVVVRTPLLAQGWLDAWGADLRAPSAPPEALADALAADRERLTAALWALASEPAVRDALLCASPSLDEAVESRAADPRGARATSAVPILVRYLVRMTMRPTPFGLFSGCTLGKVAETTRLELPPRARFVRHSRLDMHYLSALVEAIEVEPDLREHLTYRPSSALYESAGQLRYAEGRTDPETRARHHNLVSVEVSDAVRVALESARGGATMRAVAEAIAASDPEVTVEEALGFVGELVDSQVLVSNIAPAVTGPEPTPALIQALAGRGPRGGEVASVLEDVVRQIADIDAAGLGVPRARYEAVAERLRTLPAKVELPRLFQVDLFKPSPQLGLGTRFVDAVIEGIDLLRQITPTGGQTELTSFATSFTQRYEGRRVPLTEVLDEERGIGFGSSGADPAPLLDGLVFPSRGATSNRDAWLVRRYSERVDGAPTEWALEDADVEAMKGQALAPMPDAFAVFGSIQAKGADAIDEGDFTFTMGVSGPSGAALLGRFCHGDEELLASVRAHLRQEEALRPDAIFAEIVHISEGRLGNILCRPVLRDHEIPYLCRSGVAADHQIPIDDLSISVEGSRVVLWSERLGREIVPRMTNAHNHAASTLGIYRLLCRLQYQDAGGLGWDWGALASARYLPRVTRGKLVLSLAQWRLLDKDLEPLKKETGPKLFSAAQALRERLRMPRHIALADGDNVMPIDLDNVLSLETFAAMLKNRSGAVLREVYPAPDQLCVSGPEGRFTSEFVLPFVQRRAPSKSPPMRPRPTLTRTFSPGSEWLYYKLYAGSASVDPLLTELVQPMAHQALADGLCDAWFFIRYGDPDWHLRVRFHGSPGSLAALRDRLDAELRPVMDRGDLRTVVIDTYQRELERYGGDAGMDLCEALFYRDSEAVADLLRAYQGDAGGDARWRFGLLGMHLLLVDLGMDLDERIAAMDPLRAGFGAEHNVGVHFEKQLGARFRKERKALEDLLAGKLDGDEVLASGVSVLRERSARIAPIAAELRARCLSGATAMSVADLAGSLLHMYANRIVADAARAHELVLYDFLLRLYQSEKARATRGKKS